MSVAYELNTKARRFYSLALGQVDPSTKERLIKLADDYLKEAYGLRHKKPSLAKSLAVFVRTAVDRADGDARAAFYLVDTKGTELHHIIGMPQAYARYVDGFVIGPQSLACGLAVCTRRAIITPDVTEEPRWKPWLWLANKFDYRACWSFPVEASGGKIVGTFAMYYKEPREATSRDLDLAGVMTHAAAIIISPQ